MKNNILNYVLTFLIISVTAFIIFSSNELKNLPALIEMTNKTYVFLGLFCMGVYWICETFIIKYIFNYIDSQKSFRDYFKITMIGQYYNLITPFASGGQPAQIYAMTNDYKVPIGQATSVTINKFMVYHVVITFFSIVMALFNREYIFNQAFYSKIFIFAGLIINTLGIALIFALCYNGIVVKKIVITLLTLLHKFRLAKKIKEETIMQHLEEYKVSLYRFTTNKKILMIVSFFTVLQIIAYYSVTYFVYLALGLKGASYLEIIAVQSILYMAVNFIPTPGNAGVSEGGFYLLFALLFPPNLLLYAIILWRFIVYYFNLLATGTIVLFDHLIKRLKPKITRGDWAK